MGMHDDHYEAAIAGNAGAQLSGSRRVARAAKLIAWYQPHNIRRSSSSASLNSAVSYPAPSRALTAK
jgi:hypothetical protein